MAPPVLDLDDTTRRLAELVAHLTGCPARVALEAVGRAWSDDHAGELDEDGRLAVVARAMVLVRRLLDLRDQKPA